MIPVTMPMGRAMLLGHSGVSWREWLAAHRGTRDLIVLDPGETGYGFPARLSLVRDDKVIAWHLYGSLDPQRAPHLIISALAGFLAAAEPDAIVQMFPYRSRPLLRQLVVLCAQLVQPEALFIAEGTPIDRGCWPIGPEEIVLEKAFPEIVLSAQRKAQWLQMIEQSSRHTLDLNQVSLVGARLGSGTILSEKARRDAGLSTAQYAEVCGGGLLIVSLESVEDSVISQALDVTHCSRAEVVDPREYSSLLCSFCRRSGEEFGMGILQSIDFVNRQAFVLSTAVAPAPVHVLKLGTLRVDDQGRELGEAKPWRL